MGKSHSHLEKEKDENGTSNTNNTGSEGNLWLMKVCVWLYTFFFMSNLSSKTFELISTFFHSKDWWTTKHY